MMPRPGDPKRMTWGYECPRTHSPSRCLALSALRRRLWGGRTVRTGAGQPPHMRDEDLVPLTAGGLPRPFASSHRSSAQTLGPESGPPATGLLRPGLRALGRGCGASGQPEGLTRRRRGPRTPPMVPVDVATCSAPRELAMSMLAERVDSTLTSLYFVQS